MTHENFAELFQGSSISRKKMQPGDRVEALVAGISGETIFLDIGAKSEGWLDGSELKNEDGELTVKSGDKLLVYFLRSGRGEMVFTTTLGSGKASNQEFETAFQSGIPVEGKVTKEIKGGFEVMIGGTRAFCPYSQLDIRRVEDPDKYIDQSFSFKVIEFKNGGRNIVVSSRAILEEQREQQRQELEESLEEGMRVSGTVTSIQDFGAFVDIGGVDGLIPVSEIAWGSVEKVSEVLEVGMKVEVVIKQLDWERNRISLSLRETTENPWDTISKKYPVGSIHMGQVARLAQFGAFITLESGIDGLLHISKLGSGRRINHPRELLERGQEIAVRIDAIDEEKKRLSLVPDDYPDEADDRKKNKTTLSKISGKGSSMGTLGDLLQAQLQKK